MSGESARVCVYTGRVRKSVWGAGDAHARSESVDACYMYCIIESTLGVLMLSAV